MHFCRSPSINASEFPPGGPSQRPDSTQAEIVPEFAVAYQSRWNRVADAMADLDSQLTEAEVLWEGKFLEHANEVRRRLETLRFGLQEHIAFMGDRDLGERDVARVNEVRAIAIALEPDSFGAGLDDTLNEIRHICAARLRR